MFYDRLVLALNNTNLMSLCFVIFYMVFPKTVFFINWIFFLKKLFFAFFVSSVFLSMYDFSQAF